MSSSCIAQVLGGLVVGATLLFSQPVSAASCCGGGSASSLIVPKFFSEMYGVAFSYEQYDGFWNQDGERVNDPPGSDLRQYRLNFGYAFRLADNWQMSAGLPFVLNDNKYSGLESSSSGFGDATVSLWYEAFDEIKCVYDVRTAADLVPAAYFGATLTLPTGKSAYGNDVQNSFDVTGRGFYRLDTSMILDKTIYPWTMLVELTYGKYLERPVNQEYGTYVEPYRKTLGDRKLSVLSLGYTDFLEKLDTITYTLAYSNLDEDQAEINHTVDPTSGFSKESFTFTAAYATAEKDWVIKTSLNHSPRKDDWGSNFPVTDTITVELVHVLP